LREVVRVCMCVCACVCVCVRVCAHGGTCSIDAFTGTGRKRSRPLRFTADATRSSALVLNRSTSRPNHPPGRLHRGAWEKGQGCHRHLSAGAAGELECAWGAPVGEAVGQDGRDNVRHIDEAQVLDVMDGNRHHHIVHLRVARKGVYGCGGRGRGKRLQRIHPAPAPPFPPSRWRSSPPLPWQALLPARVIRKVGGASAARAASPRRAAGGGGWGGYTPQ
jgi:hypothetical protein